IAGSRPMPLTSAVPNMPAVPAATTFAPVRNPFFALSQTLPPTPFEALSTPDRAWDASCDDLISGPNLPTAVKTAVPTFTLTPRTETRPWTPGSARHASGPPTARSSAPHAAQQPPGPRP